MLPGKVRQNCLAQDADALGRDVDVGPVRTNGVLDIAKGDVALRTATRIHLPTETVEVGVGTAAVRLAAHGNTKSAAAARAEKEAFEVVRPFTALVFVQVASREERLHAGKRRFVNQRRMRPLILDAVIAKPTGVVAVAQDALHVLRAE